MLDSPLAFARPSSDDAYSSVLPGSASDCDAGDAQAYADVVGFDAEAGITLQPDPVMARGAGERPDLAPLMARICLGDEAALAALHGACASKLLASALRLVGRQELAHEAVSSAFLQVWHRAREFNADRADVLTWLHVVVRSRAIDLSRQTSARGKYERALTDAELREFADVAPQPCRCVEQSEARVGLRRALGALTPIQRQVLSLTFLEGHSHEEAAAHIGIPLGTVKSHARRGLAALRAHAALKAAHARQDG